MCCAKRLDRNSRNHPNSEVMQSAFKEGHSTETALLKIQHDIDTVDHSILLNRLYHTFGVIGKAHDWLRSYLDE